jgi:hypothetical protein
MTSRVSSLPSLPVFVGLLAVLTLGLILIGKYLGLGVDSFFLLAIPFVLAIVYLDRYRRLPYGGPRARPQGLAAELSSSDEETFEDPVEEADRIDSGVESPGSGGSVDDAPDEAAPDAPVAP